jgi:hypothetical protein
MDLIEPVSGDFPSFLFRYVFKWKGLFKSPYTMNLKMIHMERSLRASIKSFSKFSNRTAL